MLMIESKICTKCSIEKPISFFSKCARHVDGFKNECKSCRNNLSKKYRLLNPTKYRDTDRRRRLKHPRKEPSREENKRYYLKSNYGVDLDWYTNQLKIQRGLCYICKLPETSVDKKTGLVLQLSVDHDHTTGKVRKLLCGKCNTGLGLFQDSIIFLESAVDYLKGA